MSSDASEVDPLDDLADEFVDRCRWVHRPSLAESADKYPELAERIPSVVPALGVMGRRVNRCQLTFRSGI
jgi:hypothetical protein